MRQFLITIITIVALIGCPAFSLDSAAPYFPDSYSDDTNLPNYTATSDAPNLYWYNRVNNEIKEIEQYLKGSGITVEAVGFGDGTVSEPSIYFNNDPDTGMYRIGDGQIGFAINGVNSVIIEDGYFRVSGGLVASDETTIEGGINVKQNTIFNYDCGDYDFTIRKNSSGNAYKYDAGLDTHTFGSLINITSAETYKLNLKKTAANQYNAIRFLDETGTQTSYFGHGTLSNNDVALSIPSGKFELYSNGSLSFTVDSGSISTPGSGTFGTGITATTGNITASSGNLSVSGSGTFGSNFAIKPNSYWGTYFGLGASAGSYADWAMLDSATTAVMYVPTGTKNVVFGNNISASGSGTFGSNVTVGSSTADSDQINLLLAKSSGNKWSVLADRATSNHSFRIYNSMTATNAVWIDGVTTNIGIGDNNPTEKLTVAGNISASGSGTFGSTINAALTGSAFGTAVADTGQSGIYLSKTSGNKWAMLAETATSNHSFRLYNAMISKGCLWADGASNFVGIGSVPAVRLDIGCNVDEMDLPAASGSATEGIMRLGNSDHNWGGTELNFGIYNDAVSAYPAWIQAQKPNDYSVSRPIYLNPNGGLVSVGSGGLSVTGSGTFSGGPLTIGSASATNGYAIISRTTDPFLLFSEGGVGKSRIKANGNYLYFMEGTGITAGATLNTTTGAFATGSGTFSTGVTATTGNITTNDGAFSAIDSISGADYIGLTVRNTSSTLTSSSTIHIPVFNGAPGLKISQATVSGGAYPWKQGDYDSFIRTGQSGSWLHLGAGYGSTAHFSIAPDGRVGIGAVPSVASGMTFGVSGKVRSLGASGSNGFYLSDGGSDAGTFSLSARTGRNFVIRDEYAGVDRLTIDSTGATTITSGNLTLSSGSISASGSVTAGSTISTSASSAFVIGDGATEGDWRFIRSGNNLLIQRYESSAWVTKSTITP